MTDDRLDAAMGRLRAAVDGARLESSGVQNRPGDKDLDSSAAPNRLDSKAFRERVAKLAWDLNYDQFCAVIGEPPAFTHGDNTYAQGLWDNWCRVVQSLTRLGDCFDKLIASSGRLT